MEERVSWWRRTFTRERRHLWGTWGGYTTWHHGPATAYRHCLWPGCDSYQERTVARSEEGWKWTK